MEGSKTFFLDKNRSVYYFSNSLSRNSERNEHKSVPHTEVVRI